MKRYLVSNGMLIIGILALALYGSAPLFLPPPAPASIPMEQFSAGRALQHVQKLAQNPRVVGTTGMEKAASYVAGILRGCNLEPEIQAAPSKKGTLHNVVVRLPGSQPGNALLIVSHIDSVSFGAGDNASGAAVLLEMACSLKTGEQLRNDIIFLFEDGEEAGYLGGYAFAEMDPEVQAVRRVIGLDTAAWGPVVLLQTTPGNADFIRAYASSVKNPTAFGFFADADWNISNDSSELLPFYERSLSGLELEDPTAFSGKHSETDTLEKVKPGSLQQMGDQVLSLARYLGNTDLAHTSGSNLSYFFLWGLGLVHYPATWNLVFAVLSVVGWAILTGKGIRQKTMGGRAIFLATVFLFVAIIGSAILGIAGTAVFGMLFPNPNANTGSYLVPASLPFFIAAVACILHVYLFIRGKLAKRFGREEVTQAGLVFWFLLSILTAALLPVGSYIFTIPLTAAILAGFWPGRWRFARFIPASIATILFVPNVVLAFLGTGLETLVLVAILAVLNVELWAETM